MKIFLQKLIAIILITGILSLNAPFVRAQETPPSPAAVTTSSEIKKPAEPVKPAEPKLPEIKPATPVTPNISIAPPATPAAPKTPAEVLAKPTPQTLAATVTTTPDPTPSVSSLGSNPTADNSPSDTAKQKNKHLPNARLRSNPSILASQTLTPENTSRTGVIESASLDTLKNGLAPSAVINSGNGAGSVNSGSATIGNSNTTGQNNSANVSNNINGTTRTGGNVLLDHVGGDSTLASGNANISGTAVTNVNSNIDGVAVSEFNVADVQRGDLVLDYAANCVSGCAQNPGTVKNIGNGATSQNTGALAQKDTAATFQNNDANVGNNLTLVADSGNNRARDNIGGKTDITSGNANVSANSLTFANNNIKGKVQYGVVNIYGELYGDIVLPESQVANSSALLANTGNGGASSNSASSSASNTDKTFQNNDANITNNLILNTQTGDNRAADNSGGAAIKSGNTKIDANVLNIANSNISGKTWWLVLVNEAGNWVGRILGAPTGSNMAGSNGTDFKVGANGEITAVNTGNGSGSTNNAALSSMQSNQVTQNNKTNIVNNLNLSALTGSNRATDNLGGGASITTGDANIIANLVNFVNNNIVGDGKLVVTVVNVFGKWFGDFLTPGQKKATPVVANQNPALSQNQPQGSGVGSPSTSLNSQGGTSTGMSVTNNQTSPAQVSNNFAAGIKKAVFSYVMPGATQQIAGSVMPVEKVAGISTEKNSGINSLFGGKVNKKQFTLNLAWLVLFLPVIIFAIFGKRLIAKKLLPRRSA